MGWELAATIVGAVAAVGGMAAVAWRFLRRVEAFLEDWFGESERPGVPRRAGVMERLATVEHRTEQLCRNGGSSLRDAVDRIENRIADTDPTPGSGG